MNLPGNGGAVCGGGPGGGGGGGPGGGGGGGGIGGPKKCLNKKNVNKCFTDIKNNSTVNFCCRQTMVYPKNGYRYRYR